MFKFNKRNTSLIVVAVFKAKMPKTLFIGRKLFAHNDYRILNRNSYFLCSGSARILFKVYLSVEYLFKVNNEDTRSASTDFVLVSVLLTLNRFCPTVKEKLITGRTINKIFSTHLRLFVLLGCYMSKIWSLLETKVREETFFATFMLTNSFVDLALVSLLITLNKCWLTTNLNSARIY